MLTAPTCGLADMLEEGAFGGGVAGVFAAAISETAVGAGVVKGVLALRVGVCDISDETVACFNGS
jgi:hypothetical protein